MSDYLPVIKASDLDFSNLSATKGLITPETAAQMLERNFDNNRNLSSTVTKRYARLMKDKMWKLGDPIKFAETGELIDGQHRLNAVITSGEASPFVIMTGLPKQSCEVLDQGKSRTANDILSFRGVSFPYYRNSAISILRSAVTMGAYSGGSGAHCLYSSPEIATLAEHFHEGIKFSLQWGKVPTGLMYAPVLSVVFMAYYKEDHSRLSDFLYCWHHGTVLNGVEDNAAILLRNNFLQRKFSTGSDGRALLFNRTQSALSYFLKGECPRFLKETSKLLWGADLFSRDSLNKILEEKS